MRGFNYDDGDFIPLRIDNNYTRFCFKCERAFWPGETIDIIPPGTVGNYAWIGRKCRYSCEVGARNAPPRPRATPARRWEQDELHSGDRRVCWCFTCFPGKIRGVQEEKCACPCAPVIYLLVYPRTTMSCALWHQLLTPTARERERERKRERERERERGSRDSKLNSRLLHHAHWDYLSGFSSENHARGG